MKPEELSATNEIVFGVVLLAAVAFANLLGYSQRWAFTWETSVVLVVGAIVGFVALVLGILRHSKGAHYVSSSGC